MARPSTIKAQTPVTAPHFDALQEIAKLRQPFDDAVEASLRESAAGRKFVKERDALTQWLIEARAAVDLREMTQQDAREAALARVRSLKSAHESVFKELAATHARLAPSLESQLELMVGERATLDPWLIEWQATRGMILRSAEESTSLPRERDTMPFFAATEQTFGAPFTLELEENWGLTALSQASATANPDSGDASVEAAANEIGGTGARALVGCQAVVPAGASRVDISAEVQVRYWGLAAALVAVSGAGADLVLRVNRGDGAPPSEKLQSLFAILCPFAWGNTVQGGGPRLISTTFAHDPARPATDITVLVGAVGHAECGGVYSQGHATAEVHVQRIAIWSY